MSVTVYRASGKVGTPIRAKTNAFNLQWVAERGAKTVHHYDVDIAQNDLDGRKLPKMSVKKQTEIVMRLQQVVRPDLFNPIGAYDGKKNLFSLKQWPSVSSQEFQVPLDSVGRSQRPRMVSVKVVFVKKISIELLKNLLQGRVRSEGSDGDSAMTLNMLNVFVQAAPKMSEPKIHNTKSFFTPTNKHTSPSSQQIYPLELWRGFFQSVRPTYDKILVNVDVTVGVIVPSVGLEKLCADYLKLRNIHDLTALREPQFMKLRFFLKSVQVDVSLPGHTGRETRPIRGLVRNVGEEVFDRNGVQTTVAVHFKQVHNINVRPNSLGVKLGNHGLFPVSVCKTIVQLYKPRSSPEVVKEALAFTPAKPQDRLNVIQAGWQQLQYEQSPFLLGGGINIPQEPLQVNGRILPPPVIQFAREQVHLQRAGVWDVMRRKLAEPANIESWMVVDFSGGEISIINRFVNDLIHAMRDRGLNVNNVRSIVQKDGNSSIEDILSRYGPLRLIVFILPESSPTLYKRVKRFGDITHGVVTQCVKWSRKLSTDSANGKANQYHNNLILKINLKLGGLNYYPKDAAMEYIASVPTMIVGADVSHPGPGSQLPSIAALVSSWDQKACRYAASIDVQEARTEMIYNLIDMLKVAFKLFYKKNNVLPKRIFFFRDGVSEGEFEIVRDKELKAIKVAVLDIYGHKNLPELTFIVVGKRHHFRFFPASPQNADERGNGNLNAGFVVDQDIVHPIYPDFYLQSQAGLKGTSCPSHYTILRNDSGLLPDMLQQLAYALCHCYTRSTRSVKIPAPVYYADLVCRRAKFHFDDDVTFSDDMSVHSNEQIDVDRYREHFTGVNDVHKNSMYFV